MYQTLAQMSTIAFVFKFKEYETMIKQP